MALEAQPPMAGLPRETPIYLRTDDAEQQSVPKPGTPTAPILPPAYPPYPVFYYAYFPPPLPSQHYIPDAPPISGPLSPLRSAARIKWRLTVPASIRARQLYVRSSYIAPSTRDPAASR